MAASNSSPSGFSYAQAAKGRASATTSQPSSSKVTSGTATPATSQQLELTSGGSWADDVENTVSQKAAEVAKDEPQSIPQPKEVAKEVTREEEKSAEQTTAPTPKVESPAVTAVVEPSAPQVKEGSSSSPNGIESEVASDVKSQGSSEPAWIAERKERQTSSTDTDTPSKNEKKSKDGKDSKDSKDSSPAPAPKLQDAPPPSINPWMKRMEDNKSKSTPQPTQTKSAPTPAVPDVKPKPDAKKKASPNGISPRAESFQAGASTDSKPTDAANKRPSEPRPTRRSEDNIQTSAPSRPISTYVPPPSVRDEISWPTPDTAAEKERRDVSDKDTPTNKQLDDGSQAAKQRKPEWKAMPVTPNYLFETQNIRGRDAPRGGERGGRGGIRGRNAGLRGAASGNGGERGARPRDETAPGQRGRADTVEQDASAPVRAASAGSWHDQSKDARPERSARGESVAEPRPSKKKGADSTAHPDAIALPLSDGKRSKGPKTSTEQQNGKATEGEQTTRRNSIGTQTEESTSALPEVPQARIVPSETRRESRNDSGPGFTPSGRGSGSKRGGRGRGGNREQVNGHHNGQQAEAGGPFGLPTSPSMQGRGNHQFGYPPPTRGNWPRGNPRSQSIPFDAYYGRFPNAYGHQQLPPIQPVMPGMYDYPGYPMTAMPYQPYMDTQYLMDMVSTQLEYYFSIDNLLKDMFLRKNMDSQGFVLLDVIANFNRIKQLTQDREILKAVCMNSPNIEIRVGEDQQERLRRHEGWNQFLLPVDQRNPGAQNEGPQHLMRPERPQIQTYGALPYRGPASAAPQLQQRGDRRSYDASLTMGGFQPGLPYGNLADGQHVETNGTDAARGRSAKSPSHDQPFSFQPATIEQDEQDGEADSFPDDQASTLTVVVKVNKPQRSSVHSHAARTFSNGSIDSRSIFTEMGKKSTDATASPSINGDTPNGTERTSSPNKDRAGTNESEISLFWMKDQSLPSEALPTDVTLEPYNALRLKAVEQRGQAATGTCPYDMDVLYQFWCHFLIRNFNSRMYNEFKFYAHQDARDRHNSTGLQNLVKFYSQALLSHNATRDRLVRDYVELVKNEPAQLANTAFKQLRSAWRNGALNLKNRKKLNDMIDDDLKERLES